MKCMNCGHEIKPEDKSHPAADVLGYDTSTLDDDPLAEIMMKIMAMNTWVVCDRCKRTMDSMIEVVKSGKIEIKP